MKFKQTFLGRSISKCSSHWSRCLQRINRPSWHG